MTVSVIGPATGSTGGSAGDVTFGFWLARARDELANTRQAMGKHPLASRLDAARLEQARRRWYSGLVRLIALLEPAAVPAVPALPAPVGRAGVEQMLHGAAAPAASIVGLSVGLQVAASTTAPLIGRPGAPSGMAQHWARAADALAAAADLLAGHIPPGGAPLTPEGAALRAGAGIPACLARLARLAQDTIGIDATLPAWMRARPCRHAADRLAYRSMLEAAEWVAGSQLIRVANQVSDAGAGQPDLIGGLELAPHLGACRLPVDSAGQAERMLVACRDWMFRNPGAVGVGLVQAGTRLGAALSSVAADGGLTAPAHRPAWCDAALAAAQLRGLPLTGDAVHVEGDLTALAIWTRSPLQPADPTAAGSSHSDMPPPDVPATTSEVARLAAALPTLAEVLREGLNRAIRRGEVFARAPRAVFVKPERANILHAQTQWTAATSDDSTVGDLRRALLIGGNRDPAGVARLAQASQPDRLPAASRRGPAAAATGADRHALTAAFTATIIGTTNGANFTPPAQVRRRLSAQGKAR